MPNTMNDINQPDDDKATRHNSSTLDPNERLKFKLAKNEIYSLSQRVQARIDPAINVASRTTLEELDKGFPNLISETNILAEQVKKLSIFKITSYEDLYKKPCELVPDSDLKVNPKKNKKIFFGLAKALNNTHIIDAYPHEATLLKVAVLYKLFLKQDPPPYCD